jgi:hypothetical protein
VKQTIRRRLLSGCISAGTILLASQSLSSEADVPCSASIEFDPPRAVLGQQVILRVRIARGDGTSHVDWIEPTTYAGARVEWLPDSVVEDHFAAEADRNRMREARRALFPNRMGKIRVESSRLRCRVGTEGAGHEVEIPVPGAILDVADVPRSGRPIDFSGVIGPISLQAIAVPEQISLSETVRLALMVRGRGALWNLLDPLPEIAGAEIFRRRPELTVETGSRLSAVRHFVYDVVPQREGDLVLPEIRVSFFDPTTGRFESETTNPIRISVGARTPRPLQLDSKKGDPVIDRPKDDRRSITPPSTTNRFRWVSVAAALSCAGAGYITRRILRRKRRRIRALVAELESGPGRPIDPTAIAEILRSAISKHIPRIESLPAEEIAALPNLPVAVIDVVRVLAIVERARFDPNSSIPEHREILRVLKRLS